ncbi:hypothetical protein Tco_0797737 [Tanacetum coccineum]
MCTKQDVVIRFKDFRKKDIENNTPIPVDILIPLRLNLRVLQIGIRAKVIENQWVSDVEPEAPEEAPQSLEQAPPSPNYVSGPEHPPSPDYVPGPKYPKYLVPPDDEVPIEDHPLPADASPTALSPGYVADSDPLKEDPADYPTDEGDDEEESSEDDDDEEEDEASKEDEEDEEHLASTDSTTLPAIDLVPSAEDTEAFETDESAPTPPPSLLSPLLSLLPRIPSPPTHTSPTYAEALMGYKVAMV